MSIFLPSASQVVELHQRIIKASGGSPELRSTALLESALARAQAGFGGIDLYPTTEEKAAALSRGLIQNHAFVDGNKRIGVIAMLLVLRMNHIALQYAQSELISIGLDLASGNCDIPETLQWIHSHKV